MNRYSDMNSHLGQQGLQKFEYRVDIFGISEYVELCLGNEMTTFLKSRSVDCQQVSANGYNIIVSYIDSNGSIPEDYIRKVINQFLREKLSTIRMEMIPNISIENKEQIDQIFSRHAKKWVI